MISTLVTIAAGLVLATPSHEIKEAQGSITSMGKPIRVERFEPKDEGKYPAILILYGAAGMDIGGPEFREFGRELARRGYVAHIVQYFDQSGGKPANEWNVARSFPSWLTTLDDAITAVSKQPNVDAKRIGLLGFSLGSFLSLSAAGRDPRISAVVEYFGGLPDLFARNLQRYPPTLILHGDADKVVPVTEARKIERIFTEKKFPFEIKIYPGQGHRFTGDDEVDAYQRALAFFDKHIKGSG